LNIVVGYAGQLSLSNGGFLALGAYLGVLGTGRWEWPGLLTFAVAGVSAFVVSLLLSTVIFRARGLHFALLTTGISLIAYNVLVVWRPVTGGVAGLSTAGPVEEGGIVRPLDLGVVEVGSEQDYFIAMLVALVLLLLATTLLRRRKTGLSWQAIRDDEVLAASVGVRVDGGKRAAYVTSSVLVTVVGVVFGHWLGYVTPDTFGFAEASFAPLAMVIIGGRGTVLGPVVGALVVAGTPEYSRGLEDVSVLAYGVILLLVVLVAPKGIVGLLSGGYERIAAWVTRRREESA
jgi:branched-chain amino acid transport system permease protein